MLSSIDPALLGTVCCLLSALGYTAANICLRQSAALQLDPAWVICVKESVSVVVVGPLVLILILRGVRYRVGWRAVVALVLAGLAVQLVGNLPIQWAFGIVGLAVSMPLVFGTMLVASAVIGWLALGERLRPRPLLAILLVITAIGLLSWGAAPGGGAAVDSTGRVLLGLAAASLGGIAFATLGAAIRYASAQRVPVLFTVLVVTGMGVLSLGALTLVRLGYREMLATQPRDLAWMVASGACNLGAFALLSKGLQLTTLVHANILNVSQIALGAAAGMLLFGEPLNSWLLAGIVLTLIGIVVFGRPGSSAAGEPQPAGEPGPQNFRTERDRASQGEPV